MMVQGLKFFITGGAAGLGAGTARVAAKEGGIVTICDVDDSRGQRLANEITDFGGTALYLHCDVTDERQVVAAMKRSADTHGGIDVLHNNAGIHDTRLHAEPTLDNLTADHFRRILEVDLVAPWVCAKAALPYLRSSRNASIINAGSVASFVRYATNLCYGAAKGGIALLTKNLALALAPDRIRANCYCPGAFETEGAMIYAERVGKETFVRTQTAAHLIPRLGKPEEIGYLVCFLASEKAAFINGVCYLIDGGSLAWRGTIDQLGMEPLP
jgi:NAD(P)-dependent dehydrogenase (short-subunit alcohol dehydrogenase family)